MRHTPSLYDHLPQNYTIISLLNFNLCFISTRLIDGRKPLWSGGRRNHTPSHARPHPTSGPQTSGLLGWFPGRARRHRLREIVSGPGSGRIARLGRLHPSLHGLLRLFSPILVIHKEPCRQLHGVARFLAPRRQGVRAWVRCLRGGGGGGGNPRGSHDGGRSEGNGVLALVVFHHREIQVFEAYPPSLHAVRDGRSVLCWHKNISTRPH